jgi:hypothetical protein
METAIVAAFVAGGLALAGTTYTIIANYLGQREQARFKFTTDERLKHLDAQLQNERDARLARAEADKVVAKFRDPLMHAAYDLQSRIFNILEKEFLIAHYANGSEREKFYAQENTVFLVAQFLGWTELIRQEVQFLDLGVDDQTRQLRRLQNEMYSHLQNDKDGPGFRLFAGEQRAVGELMIDRSGPLPRCIGFAAFLKSRDKAIDVWLDPLRENIRQMASAPRIFESRLIKIQRSLIDLLLFLDPKYLLFPENSRTKLT